MEIRLAELCDYAIRDDKGKVSILGVFDKIYFTSLPARQRTMFLATSIQANSSKDVGKHKYKAILKDPKDKNHGFAIERDFELTHSSNTTTLITGIGDLVFSDAGRYEFIIEIDSKEQKRIWLILEERK